MLCEHVSSVQCPNGHPQEWKCHKGPPPTCIKCERQQELAEKKRQERFAQQEKRDAEQRDHERQMAELVADEARQRETIRNAQEAKERKRALEQKRMDVEAAVEQARAATSLPAQVLSRPEPPRSTDFPSAASVPVAPHADGPIPEPQPTPTVSNPPPTSGPAAKPKISAAKEEWERQKRLENAVNPPIDAIMAMTGLEDVKKQVLRIKSKVDTSIRQGTDLKGERFNIAMLGNPGTGMTHYRLVMQHTNFQRKAKPLLPVIMRNSLPRLTLFLPTIFSKLPARGSLMMVFPESRSKLKRCLVPVGGPYLWTKPTNLRRTERGSKFSTLS